MMNKESMSIGICYIAYSRVEKCRETLEALCTCRGVEDYDIYIFSDAPFNAEIENQVKDVRDFLHSYVEAHNKIKFHVYESEANKGSFKNISSALNFVAQKHTYVALVEEDVLVGNSFLDYLCSAIAYYKDDRKVFGFSAYNPVPCLDIAGDGFYSERFCCYGLCMKSEDILSVEWDIDKLELEKINKTQFYDVARDISACFDDDLHGRRDFQTSWDIILYYNMLISQKLQVLPRRSYCTNIGFDGSGEWSSVGGFKNNNFQKELYQSEFHFKEQSISEEEYRRFIAGFIQDSPKKKMLRMGRRISSWLHISKLARSIKKRYIR